MIRKYAIATSVALVIGLTTTIPQAVADDGVKPAANPVGNQQPTPGTSEYVECALRKKVSIDVDKEPLKDVLKDLSEQVGVSILVQTSDLDAVGLFADEIKVTISLEGLSLRSVLRVVLADLELTYLNYEGVVLVTTPESAEQNLVTKVYDVVDLISRDEKTPPNEYDYASLINAIQSTVDPMFWDEVGGPGSIDGYRGTIVVSVTTELHQQLTTFLSGMRKARDIAPKHRDSAPPVVSISLSGTGEEPEEEKAIFKALDSLVSLEFDGTPLREVALQISKQHEINVLLKESALDAVGLGPRTPVTFSVKNIKLRSALRLMFSDLELAYHVHDGVLWITTPEDAEENLITRAYPVFDIVDAVPAGSDFISPYSEYDYNRLTDMLTVAVTPTMWDEVGGPASIGIMHGFGILVISHTQEGHDDLENLLRILRKTASDMSRVVQPSGKHRTRLVVYALPKPEPVKKDENEERDGAGFARRDRSATRYESISDSAMLDFITSLIEPNSWSTRDDVYARAEAGRIVIRHTDSVHRQIRELADRLGVPTFRQMSPSNWDYWLGGGFQ